MRSLRSRLWLLWGMALVASVGVGFLLIQLYQTTSVAQVGRAEAVVTRACDAIRDRYGFYVAGWGGDGAGPADAGFRQDLAPVVQAALASQPAIEGGIWSATAGSLVYAYPTDHGTGNRTPFPAADLPTIQAANQDAGQAEQAVLRSVSSGARILLLAACPLDGPYSGLTAWTMSRVQRAQGYDSLRIGLGLLLLLVLGIAGWVTWLTALWGRHVRGIETALALHAIEDLPLLPPTGERELDRIVTALNDAGQRLAQAKGRSAEMAAQIAASDRLAALGRIAAGVAHEIRNPMAAMRLRTENALAGDTARHRPALEASLGQIARVDRLVGELLAMTQRRTPEPQNVRLAPFLEAVAADHGEQAAAAGVVLATESPAAAACFDPGMIRRALDNLLLNAIQHTPRGGRVTLQAEDAGDRTRIIVTDNGSGIDQALWPRLFESFVTGRADGTGLGLAIAREMVEAHGGRLTLANADGPGARFIIDLPRGGAMPRILIVDDDAALRESMVETLTDLGHHPVEAVNGGHALDALATQHFDAILLDLRMPGLDGLEVLARIRARPNPPPVAVLTAVATAANTIEAMRLGAADHLTKPVGREDLAALLERLLARGAAAAPVAAVPQPGAALVGASAAMREVQKSIGLLADSEATVLIAGETGTGKEVVARALHRHGRRRDKPFVAVNCAAIPVELLESQLFGHVRGAFTGAIADRPGSFREAQGGTLFLDEIGDMDLAMQAKMLRVLQERVVVPVGGKPAPVDVRIVAASHRDLPEAVRLGQFRQDLFYRLGVVPLTLPPLRDRLADIVPLAEHFLAQAAEGGAPRRLTAAAAAVLLRHDWPGNVRELQNAMHRVTALLRRPVIDAADFAFLMAAKPQAAPVDWLAGDLDTAVARLETAMIQRALAAAGGNRTDAARRLGIHRQLLHTKLRRYGLEAS